jgi:hypothetical protein
VKPGSAAALEHLSLFLAAPSLQLLPEATYTLKVVNQLDASKSTKSAWDEWGWVAEAGCCLHPPLLLAPASLRVGFAKSFKRA